MTKKKVAIFDIDGTIFRSSLLIEVVEGLVVAGIFPKNSREAYQKSYQDWINRKGTYETYIWDVIRVFEKNIKGVRHQDFLKVAKKIVDVHKDRVYTFTRDLVKDLKKKNYFLLAISHSPKELVDEFCENLGFDKVYGRVYEFDKNKNFTGNTLYLDLISDKAKILQRAVEKENLTLAGSVAVGDTDGDISLLSSVAKPICFNPNKKLYTHGVKAGWSIVVERKDVVYKM
jgi:HAD superfamily hydrolase (TIGR01490 family)